MVASAVLLGCSGAGWAEDEETARSADSGFHGRFIGGRLFMGLRMSRWRLEDSRRYVDARLDNNNRRANFLGSLWGLDALPGFVPTPFVECRVVSVVGAGVAYDQVRVRTLDWANPEHSATAGDGDLRIRGVQVYAFGSLPNRTRVTPLVRVGFSRYSAAFFETGGWALPGRFFEVEDTQGWFVDATLRVSLGWRLSAEASYEHLWLRDVAARAGSTAGAFPVRSDVVRVGLAYGF
jgi:hypothetical protein